MQRETKIADNEKAHLVTAVSLTHLFNFCGMGGSTQFGRDNFLLLFVEQRGNSC